MISDALIKELQVIAKEEGNMDLSLEESRRAGEALVKYFEILMKIDKDKKTTVKNSK